MQPLVTAMSPTTGGPQTRGSQTWGSQTGVSQTGGYQTGGSQTGVPRLGVPRDLRLRLNAKTGCQDLTSILAQGLTKACIHTPGVPRLSIRAYHNYYTRPRMD